MRRQRHLTGPRQRLGALSGSPHSPRRQERGSPGFLGRARHVSRLPGARGAAGKAGSWAGFGNSQKMEFSSSADWIFNFGDLSFVESVAFGWRPVSKVLCVGGDAGSLSPGRCTDGVLGSQPQAAGLVALPRLSRWPDHCPVGGAAGCH